MMTTTWTKKDFEDDIARGMEVLFVSVPIFSQLVQRLGFPKANPYIPTARVVWDNVSKRISFEINPHFIHPLTDDEVAAVISHETYHVVLNHLPEILDKQYKNQQALIDAHECIINDGLYNNVGVRLPNIGARFGTELYDQDFSIFSTRQGYDFIMSKMEEQEENGEGGEGDQEKGDSSQGQGAGASGGQGGDSSPQDDKSDEDQESTGASGGTDDDSSEEQDDQEGAGGGNSSDEDADGDQDSQGAGAGDDDEQEEYTSPTSFDCGGVAVDEADVEDFKKAITKAVKDVLNNNDPQDIPDELKEILDDITPIPGSGWGIGSHTGFITPKLADSMDVNWFKILAEINPKIKSSGRKRPKDAWHRPPRNLMSVYPSVILPSKEFDKPDNRKKGDSLPTIIVALDLSGSIPRHLVSRLMNLVNDIPEKLFKAIPVTWSDYVREYDPAINQVVQAGGTNVLNLYRFAEEVEKNTGVKPYVFNITDGDCSFRGRYYSYSYPNNTNTDVDADYVKKYWYWCAIQDHDVNMIRSRFVQPGYAVEEHVYKLSEFTKR